MNNSSPFGQSLQGSRSFQNNTQSAPQQMFGGFQPQQSFGGFGSGQGFGGFNPMFGGIGGLGFNPMMGPQFSMPMQGFNPYQQHVQFQQPGLGGLGGGPGQHDRISNPFTGPGFGSRLPMYGGIGGLGFNPMMGGQFMQPMQKFAPYQQFQQPQDFGSLDMRYRGGPQMSPEMRLRREQDMRALESQANASLTGATGASNLGMMALQQAALRNASPQKLATPVENRYSLPSNNWWETLDA